MKNLRLEPECPYCGETQYDYDGALSVVQANYGERVIYFCEFYDTCGKPFYITKVEREPLYKTDSVGENEQC